MSNLKYILIFCLFFVVRANAQNSEKKIKTVIQKKGYEYIPISYLNDSTIVGITHFFNLNKSNSKIRNFEISWRSLCIDGTYYLQITPEQIYLYSGHENPNPNMLYWIININNEVLNSLRKNYKKITDLGCSSNGCFDEKYNEEGGIKDCDNVLLKQTERIISKINKLIVEEKFKIDFNKRIEPMKTLFYGYSEEEIINSNSILIEMKQ
jgi:hypothetical protein